MFLSYTQSVEKNHNLKTTNNLLAPCVCTGRIILHPLQTWQNANTRIWERHWQIKLTCAKMHCVFRDVRPCSLAETDVSEGHAVSLRYRSGDIQRGRPYYTESEPRRSQSLQSSSREPQFSKFEWICFCSIIESDKIRPDFPWKWLHLWSCCFDIRTGVHQFWAPRRCGN